jgi:hypothetical protein
MNKLFQLSNVMNKFVTRYVVIPVVLLLVGVLVIMEVSPIGSVRLKALNDGLGMLDMLRFGYSQSLVYAMLAQIGPAGRLLYSRLLGVDFVFALVYMTFQSLMITNLMRRAKIKGNWRLLNLLPFLRSALDMLENCALLGLIFFFPLQLPWLVVVSSTLTVLKWAVYTLVLLTLFSLGALTTINNFKGHKGTLKASETL